MIKISKNMNKVKTETLYFSSIFPHRKFCEGVGTSKIRTSKGQNVESFFKDDQNVERSERQKSECQKERQKSKNDF